MPGRRGPDEQPSMGKPTRFTDDQSDGQWHDVIQRLNTMQPNEPDEATLERIWQRVQSQTVEHPQTVEQRPAPAPFFTPWRLATTAAIAVLISIFGTVTTLADAALPGSALYPVKRTWEDVRWQLTWSPENRASYGLTLADRRMQEAVSLVELSAESDLIIRTMNDSFSYLERVVALDRLEKVREHIETWQNGIAEWPDPYDDTGHETLNTWLERHENWLPALDVPQAEPTPTPAPVEEESPAPAEPASAEPTPPPAPEQEEAPTSAEPPSPPAVPAEPTPEPAAPTPEPEPELAATDLPEVTDVPEHFEEVTVTPPAEGDPVPGPPEEPGPPPESQPPAEDEGAASTQATPMPRQPPPEAAPTIEPTVERGRRPPEE